MKRLRRLESHELPGGARIFVARTFGQRLIGLIGLRSLAPGCALLFPACDSVHTAFMRMPIDVVFLDADGAVLAVRRSMRPWRVTRCAGAAAVLECAAGGADAIVSGRCCRAATRP